MSGDLGQLLFDFLQPPENLHHVGVSRRRPHFNGVARLETFEQLGSASDVQFLIQISGMLLRRPISDSQLSCDLLHQQSFPKKQTNLRFPGRKAIGRKPKAAAMRPGRARLEILGEFLTNALLHSYKQLLSRANQIGGNRNEEESASKGYSGTLQLEFLLTSYSASRRSIKSVPENPIATGSESVCAAKKQYPVNASEATNTRLVQPETGRRLVVSANFGTRSPQW
jgi:hypothetical protein